VGEDARKGRRGERERERSERAFTLISETSKILTERSKADPSPALRASSPARGEEESDKKKPRLAPGFPLTILAAFDQKVTLQLLM
jgi:hypothetical protein